MRRSENFDEEFCEMPVDQFNQLDAGYKATTLTYTMSIKDFHKLFIGRLSRHGVEAEVVSLCMVMCEKLHAKYPLVIKTPAEYFAANNGAKFNA
jgi:hypothetical protein